MNVVVTGGGTIAPIDDVRLMTNVSSGRFAAAISETFLDRGASVWHIHAPSSQLPLWRWARFAPDAADPSAELERAAAQNVKRVVRGKPDSQSPWDIASFLELKTVWHPVGQ